MKIKQAIKSSGISIKHVSRATGVNYFTLVAWLNDRCRPRLCDAKRITEYLNSRGVKIKLNDWYEQ